MTPFVLVPFAIGTIAFFVTLYLALVVPEANEGTLVARESEGARDSDQPAEPHPLRRWDTVITWLMWGGWGVAMAMRFLDRNSYLDRLMG